MTNKDQDQLLRVSIANHWGKTARFEQTAVAPLTEDAKRILSVEFFSNHRRLFLDCSEAEWVEVFRAWEEGWVDEDDRQGQTEDIDPKTLEDLRKLIHNALALPYAWEKVGLGASPVGPVASYCRDRAAHIAQVLSGLLAKRSARNEEFVATMAGIAQGVVNIDSGLTTIEKDSVVHRAMVALCEAVTAGKVGVL